MASKLAKLILAGLLAACSAGAGPQDDLSKARREMVQKQVRARGVEDRRVLTAMEQVPRHRFVPDDMRGSAYDDKPLPIGWDQTISQPYIVGLMTDLLDLKPSHKVLEIGTGSGYQAAVLSRLVADVYTIEIVKPLGEQARGTLERLGYSNVHTRIGDGYKGWPEAAPFDAIIVTAAPPQVPKPLLDQLAPGGKLVVPEGSSWQDLTVYTRQKDGSFHKETVLPVRFVPMTGEAQQ
ncbi:MAG TPA: protein-L-isoaspartate(D-aspartate) O-methyltransferase [Thermoanaerobaculia bacterium]|nr:protein-L-isoaspartate(D-aspartate) O-methyltransferase [Thermoanaerobaculia bacterium]